MVAVKIDSLEFKNRMKKMKPFISTEETRYYLNGVYLEYDGQYELKATATNGHILRQMILPLSDSHEPCGEKVAGILPRQAIDHLDKIISKSTGGLGALVTFEDGANILFDFGDVTYRTHLIDGTFPHYTRVIPNGEVSLKKGMRAEYLMAALKALGNNPVDISTDDEGKESSAAHLFSSPEQGDVKCVIMPMRV